MAKISLGGEVFALSGMVDHMLLSKDCHGLFEDMTPGVAGLEDCGGLFTHLQTKKMIAEKYPVRHFLRIQQALKEGDLENVCSLPGTENPAGSLTKERGDMVPLRLLESGAFCPGHLRPLRGLAWKE